jgi:hypothetical protein
MITQKTLPVVLCVLMLTTASGCCEGVGDIASIAGRGIQFYQDISTGPGTDAMKGAGCLQAFVITPEALEKLTSTIREVADKKDANPPPTLQYTMTICQVQSPKGAPTCKEIAKAYAEQAKPTDALFGVIIQTQGDDNKPLCEGLYNASGERKQGLKRDEAGNVDTSFMPEK